MSKGRKGRECEGDGHRLARFGLPRILVLCWSFDVGGPRSWSRSDLKLRESACPLSAGLYRTHVPHSGSRVLLCLPAKEGLLTGLGVSDKRHEGTQNRPVGCDCHSPYSDSAPGSVGSRYLARRSRSAA